MEITDFQMKKKNSRTDRTAIRKFRAEHWGNIIGSFDLLPHYCQLNIRILVSRRRSREVLLDGAHCVRDLHALELHVHVDVRRVMRHTPRSHRSRVRICGVHFLEHLIRNVWMEFLLRLLGLERQWVVGVEAAIVDGQRARVAREAHRRALHRLAFVPHWELWPRSPIPFRPLLLFVLVLLAHQIWAEHCFHLASGSRSQRMSNGRSGLICISLAAAQLREPFVHIAVELEERVVVRAFSAVKSVRGGCERGEHYHHYQSNYQARDRYRQRNAGVLVAKRCAGGSGRWRSTWSKKTFLEFCSYSYLS